MRAGCRAAEGEGSPISFFPFLISLAKNWYYHLFLNSRNEIILSVLYLGSFKKNLSAKVMPRKNLKSSLHSLNISAIFKLYRLHGSREKIA